MVQEIQLPATTVDGDSIDDEMDLKLPDDLDLELEESVDGDEAGGGTDEFNDFAKLLAETKEIMAATEVGKPSTLPQESQVAVSTRPAVVDDFIRNFLADHKMDRTLSMFQTEWYELQRDGKLPAEDVTLVPDLYVRNQAMQEQIRLLQGDIERARGVAARARATFDKFRKERDFHRMHHRRVVQEKNKLITDMRRLKSHYEQYEPTILKIRQKYELAMKEKMMVKLEKDRLQMRVEGLSREMAALQTAKPAGQDTQSGQWGLHKTHQSASASADQAGRTESRFQNPQQTQGSSPQRKAAGGIGGDRGRSTSPSSPSLRMSKRDSVWPSTQAINPYEGRSFNPLKPNELKCQKTHKGHAGAVTRLAFHPKMNILATVSDDSTWRTWSVPNGELIMSGEGHKDFVCGVAFHPGGSMLATSSGDGLCKLWDLASEKCAKTFTEHTGCVWATAFHHSGDFLATCSMDQTVRLYDLQSMRPRNTYRGHVDSVNHVNFVPYTNTITSASADKTLSLWDMRTALCTQTFYGHTNAVLHAASPVTGHHLASCDADGCVRVWDTRAVQEVLKIECGQATANASAFDFAGGLLFIASADASVKVFDITKGTFVRNLEGHTDAVNDVIFDPSGSLMVTGSSDNTVKIWQ